MKQAKELRNAVFLRSIKRSTLSQLQYLLRLPWERFNGPK